MPGPTTISEAAQAPGATARAYPMSPLQQAMLFQSLQAPEAGVNLEQLVITPPPGFDVAKTQAVTDRFAALRASFQWNPEPVMLVHERVTMPFRVESAELAEFLAADRKQGFAFDRAPLSHFTLLASGELVWTFQHALLDGRSFAPVLRALFEDSPVEEDRFGEYLEWRAALDCSGSETFWRETFAGLEKPHPLRAPRGAGTGQGEIEQTWSGLGVATHTFVQGAWALLLSHYTRSEEVVFGSVRACRRGGFPAAEEVVGLLINTVPLRVPAPVDAPVGAWLRQVRERHLALRPHEQTPLNLIQEWSGWPASEPLFETLLAFENRELGFGTELHENTGFPLTLNVYATDHLRVKLSYDRRRFDDAFAAGILRHFHTLLRGLLAADEKTPLRDITMLAADEIPAPVTQTFPPRYESLIRWFETQANATPDATALTFEGKHLSYRTLNARANALALRLRESGVGKGTLVAICLPRSPETVIAMLAVLKAGAGYVPLEPNIPAERLAFILEDTQAPLLIDEKWLQSSELGEAENLATAPAPDAVAYVIYTSGSTGQPKGVLVQHRHVLRLMDATEAWFHFGPTDTWTFFHSFAFDFSVWEIWGALLYGGRLVIVPHLVSRAPDAFLELLAREKVTVLNQTPSAFRQLIEVEGGAPRELALRLVIFGGEALDPRTLAPWFARHGDAQPQLVNMYGITETTVHVTYRPLTTADAEIESSVIGEPIPDLSLHVLDRFGAPCPVGVAGELHVGGAGVSAGYLRRPELTAERFVQNGTLYRTGDLVRRLPGGELEYLGRIDAQVKIRGHRIELGEVESALRALPGIEDAVVLPHGTGLAAWMRGKSADDELRAGLRRSLPEYMVPATFTFVDAWPLTANGKLDRARLPQPHAAAPAAQRPRTSLETVIADAWCEALAVRNVELDRNFFDSGGDSLRLLQVWARLKKSIAPDLPVVALFAHPTVAELARHLTPSVTTAVPDNTAARRQASLRNLRALRQRTTS